MNKIELLDYDPLNHKDTLSKFDIEFKSIQNTDVKNKLTCVIKLIIFLETSFKMNQHRQNRFLPSLIFDSLCAINSILNGTTRHFYFEVRSMIENSLRLFLNLDNENETGVNKLFTMFEESIKNTDIDSLIIKSYYSNACDYVHNNYRANLNIDFTFKQIKDNYISEKEIIFNVNLMYNLIEKICEIYIIKNPHHIEHAFFKEKSSLKFLLNSKLYKVYISQNKD